MNTLEKSSSPETPSYSKEEKQKLLNDLELVGDKKPVGYLPLSTLVEICGVDPESKKAELEAKGLVVHQFNYPEETTVVGGALYTYSHEALSRILQSNRQILEQNGWPVEPDEFVRHLKVFAEDRALYRLVMQVFADYRLQNE